jgi:site-specific DNA recombinase
VKRAVIYARVSTTPQKEEGTSLDTQAAGCHSYARASGFHVVAEYQEQMSAATLRRPKLDQLIDMVERREVDVVICYRIDRLSRDTGDTLYLLNLFTKHGVQLHTSAGPIEDTPEGELLVTMLAAVGKFEKRNIAERFARGKIKSAQQGQVLAGAAPYGYQFVKGAGRLEILPSEAVWAEQIHSWYTGPERVSLNDILRQLVIAGAPARGGRRWHCETLRKILTSETYCGVWHWGKRKSVPPKARRDLSDREPRTSYVMHPREEWIAVPCPAIVSREVWEKAQRRMAENKERSRRNSRHDYLLGGHIWCAECWAKYGGRSRRVRENTFLTYDCSGKNVTRKKAGGGPAGCSSKNLHAAKLEEFIWQYVTSTLTDPHALLSLAVKTEDDEEAERRDGNVLEGIMAELAALDRQEERLVELFDTGGTTRPIYDKRRQTIQERRRGLATTQAEVERRARERWLKVADEAAVKELVEVAATRLPDLTFEERREVVHALDLRVVVFPDHITVSGIITPHVVPSEPGSPDLNQFPYLGVYSGSTTSAGDTRAVARIDASVARTGQRRKAGEKVQIESLACPARAPRTTRRTTPSIAPPTRHK